MPLPIDLTRSPVPAVAQVLAEAALQRQNMLLGADKGISGAGAPGTGNPTGGVPPLPTPNPAAPLAPPPLPDGASDPALADRVSLSPRASQALQAQGQNSAAAAAQQGRGVAVPPAAIPTLAAAGAGGVTGAAWPASGVSPAMRGLLDALVQQLTPAAPQRVVTVQPWGAGLGGRWRPARRLRPASVANLAGGPGPVAHRTRATRLHRHAAGAYRLVAGLAHGFAAPQPGASGHAAGGFGGAQPGAHQRAFCAGAAAGCGGG